MKKKDRVLTSNLISTVSKNARSKLLAFLFDPSERHLLTLAEYESLEPYDKGYATYLQSSWKQSEIPGDVNPFNPCTPEWYDFQDGSFCAMQEASDLEE